jgi:hypothetical protein
MSFRRARSVSGEVLEDDRVVALNGGARSGWGIGCPRGHRAADRAGG